MRARAFDFWNGNVGQDIAEYALILAVIVLAAVGAIKLFWSAVNHLGQ